MRLADAGIEVLSLFGFDVAVEDLAPEFRPDLTSNRLGLPLVNRIFSSRLQSRNEEPIVLFLSRVQRCPRKRIIMIAKRQMSIRRLIPVIRPAGYRSKTGVL